MTTVGLFKHHIIRYHLSNKCEYTVCTILKNMTTKEILIRVRYGRNFKVFIITRDPVRLTYSSDYTKNLYHYLHQVNGLIPLHSVNFNDIIKGEMI